MAPTDIHQLSYQNLLYYYNKVVFSAKMAEQKMLSNWFHGYCSGLSPGFNPQHWHVISLETE